MAGSEWRGGDSDTWLRCVLSTVIYLGWQTPGSRPRIAWLWDTINNYFRDHLILAQTHSNQVISTHIILLKEIEKCIPDCQRKEFPMIYTKMFLEHFSPPSSIFKKILKTNIPWIRRGASGQHLEMILRIEICCHFSPQGSTVRTCNKHNTPAGWREPGTTLSSGAGGSRRRGRLPTLLPYLVFITHHSSLPNNYSDAD